MPHQSTPLDRYLSEIYTIHASGTGVKETSYYPPLTNLFNTIGRTLKPRVHGILNPKGKGAGIPDIGFYTSSQLKRGELTPNQATNPERGAVEAKGSSQNIEKLAQSAQVKRYLGHYGLVLVTNLREFLLLEADENGNPIYRERYTVGSNETQFWLDSNHNNREQTVNLHSERLTEFIRRVLLYKAPITAPEELAYFLASYAREGLARLEQTADLPALAQLRQAIEQSLGIKFDGSKGAHFFRSTLVQTLFYGVFSAWVLWSRTAIQGAQFDWRTAAWTLHVPMIRSLFEEISKPSTLKPLGLFEVLDWTAAVLNRVQRTSFFKRFQEEHAVQYFYEPFLEAFDPELRKDLGVWYTPPEIVEYMVERVDYVLRTELQLPDGLADPNVYVLDPACGTGAYLVEVVRRIAKTLDDQGADALTRQDLKQAVRERLYGFELLPAPFVVAHLQLGLLLQELGAPLNSEMTDERAAVYLTNALTGWDKKSTVPPLTGQFYPELRAEFDAAREVKQKKPILVVLGNPPYNAFAGTSSAEEQGLVDPYKKGLVSEWKVKKFNLDELYVRFFRLAERRVAETTGRGIVCFISNFSYLRDTSFVVMREHLLSNFDKMWFDNLNGDSRETGKKTIDGEPDPSVFSTEQNKAGIRTGTAISLLVRRTSEVEADDTETQSPRVYYRDFWGKDKREQLIESLSKPDFELTYQLVNPIKQNRYSFRGGELDVNYEEWPLISEIAARPQLQGLDEDRQFNLISIDKERLAERMRKYFDPTYSLNELETVLPAISTSDSNFDAKKTRARLLKDGFSDNNIVRYSIRPFDQRWSYYTTNGPLWKRPRPDFGKHVFNGNHFLLTRPKSNAQGEGVPMFWSNNLVARESINGKQAAGFPILTTDGTEEAMTLFGDNKAQVVANLSPNAVAYLVELGYTNINDLQTASLIWYHALAIGYSSNYRLKHASGLSMEWPRIPLPSTSVELQKSATLGREIADLLDADKPLKNVSHQPIIPLQSFGTLLIIPSATKADLELVANWGHGGNGKPVMPGPGKIEIRDYKDSEKQALEELFTLNNINSIDGYALVGSQAYDVYLNSTTFWSGIPAQVWEFTIGGFQVIKKWLSYREQPILKRALNVDEARYVTQVVRRLLTINLMQHKLNANYETVASNTYQWPKTKSPTNKTTETD